MNDFDDELWGGSDAPVEQPESVMEETTPDNTPQAFTEDELFGDPGDNQPVDNNDVPAPPKEEGDFMTRFLRKRAIDRNKIRVVNEDNEEEEINFDDLSDDEKLSILESSDQPMLSDTELSTINFLRQHNTDLNGFAEAIRKQTIDELNNQSSKSSVDQVSDDDLYRFDLIERYGFDREKDAEQIERLLARDKEDENLFNRKINALRQEYKQLEADQEEEMKRSAEAEQMQQWETMKDNLVQVARNTNVINGLELDNNDKNEVLSFILNQDEVTGQTDFYKMCSDPEMLFKMAWFATKGDEAFRAVEDYYKAKLAEARREAKKTTVVNKARV